VLLLVRPSVELARMQWEQGLRRLESLDEPPAREAVYRRVTAAIVDELHRRLGQTFTLAQLTDEYDMSARWCRDVAQRTTSNVWAHDLSLVADAAFARFARGAIDFRPSEG
jgi:hypothetical protein